MGNIGSSCSNCWRSFGKRGNRRSHSHPQPPQPELTNKNVFAAAYTSQYPNPPPPDTPYYQNPNGGACYPPPPFPTSPLSATDDDDHRTPMDRALEAWVDGIYPPSPLVDRQTFTIRNNVNLKKETLKIEADEENPGKVLVSFTFDASVPCNISLYFFAKEGEDGGLTTIKEESLPPLKLSFQQGLGQIFRQKPGTGRDLSTFEEAELCKGNETGVYPLAVKVEATPSLSEGGNLHPVSNLQITEAVFENNKGEYKVKVVNQILWVEGLRYDLQEIYGIGNSVDDGDYDGNDLGKECVICLSKPRDTTVLPCRHMCMCSGCAKSLRFQTNHCPICRQPVKRLLEIKVNSEAAD